MKDLLFLLHDARIRAFGHGAGPGAPQALHYEGKEDMPCAGPRDLDLYLRYMLDNYGGAELQRLNFVCMDADSVADCAGAAAGLAQRAALALFTLEWLLPSFCRKLGSAADQTVSFDGRTWNISGDKVEKADAHAACPFELKAADVARLFFAPEPQAEKAGAEATDLGLHFGELARYVDGSNVQPKSSTGGERRG